METPFCAFRTFFLPQAAQITTRLKVTSPSATIYVNIETGQPPKSRRNQNILTYVRTFMRGLVIYVCATLAGLSVVHAQEGKNGQFASTQLELPQYDLSADGKIFLLNEARQASFFLLGELHGENEIPALLRELWPQMWRDGYRNIAAEVSPWAAHQLEFAPADGGSRVQALWSKEEAQFAHSVSNTTRAVLWGCDMDEVQPHLLIRDLAAANVSNLTLRQMAEITKTGYRRSMAPQLLELAQSATGIKDPTINDSSLYANLVATLEIERDRLNRAHLSASLRRESLMKNLFLVHYQKNAATSRKPKILLRFGRNHLHRGYDRRGVSTLGNFVAEFALAQHRTSFHVAAFAAGGKYFLGKTFDADERPDDPAFELLASVARYPATVLDLRPLRPILHQIPDQDRSTVQKGLIYWADSYDAMICYREVTPFYRKINP